MSALFSDEWMKQLMDAWNAAPDVKDKLAEIGFNSVICCGFKDEENPRGVFVVENGVCVRAGDWNGEAADWDMRADMNDWLKWVKKGIGTPQLRWRETHQSGRLRIMASSRARPQEG